MSLFYDLLAWLSPSRVGPKPKDPDRLRMALEILNAYGTHLETVSTTGQRTIKRPASGLPYPKQLIADAISYLLYAIQEPSLQAAIKKELSAEEAKEMASPWFEDSLKAGMLALDDFVSDAEVDAEEKQWNEMLELADKLEPGSRARLTREN